ncbi:hypothetical protein OpiT1DRAFT_03642 [Opitutaceae bacterium TAV1]|nr:hypothetical protein OpiT1DRAFT_03638 [Opitutaceae bacterium TAV1]EIP99134.1 hypothetical protein OpiT1DRAFT_03642 [Opitutaceae bacterium TAV1]
MSDTKIRSFALCLALSAAGTAAFAAEGSSIIYHTGYVEAHIVENDPYTINTPFFFMIDGKGPDTIFMKSGEGTLTFDSASSPIVLKDILFEEGTIEIASGNLSVTRNLAFGAGTTLALDPGSSGFLMARG